jgi:hypothetical protein
MRRLASFLLLVAWCGIAIATPYIPLERITLHQGETHFEVPPFDATYNHMTEFIQLSSFEGQLQYNEPGLNFGGQREEESGYWYNVMETDNTLEAIQVWSRFYELTGDSRYLDEIADAWVYAWEWPAWEEGAGYYSSHNCAWALAAELQYRTATGDTSQWIYASNSADYILQTSLPLSDPLYVMVQGWCCGNLYLYGEVIGNQTYMTVASQRAQAIMTWVEASPQSRLALESWAMSSGTFVWGLCNSIFRRDPALGQQWLATYGPMVQVYEPSLPSWSNAWNVAYCNAQGGMYQVTANPIYADNHLMLTNMLLHKDIDNDGGIPASADPSAPIDASWVSNYLALMGCDYYLGQTLDAGVVAITSPRNYTGIQQGVPLQVTALLGNWGTQALTDVIVSCDGAFQEALYVNLPAFQNTSVTFGVWTPAAPGIDSIWVTVDAPGDTNIFNDTDISRFRIRSAEDSPVTALNLRNTPDPFNPSTAISYQLSAAGQVNLRVYDIVGRLVADLVDQRQEAGIHVAVFEGSKLTSGVYLYTLSAGDHTDCRKMVLLK